MAAETDLAYLAGLIDGEGCIRIKKTKAYRCQNRQTPGYHASISVRMVDEASIAFLHETLGGWYYLEKWRHSEGRPLFCWQASDQVAGSVLRALLPYLRLKRQQAETVLELLELKTGSGKHRTKITGYRNFPNQHGTARTVPNLALSDEFVARCDALYLRCREQKRAA
jgi:hypothetical protein